ncbi:hypothetical protein T4E_1317 [Trichinella pseudospiralis]|uniref:Uncharacterized protein n=1 Tax=Trichinella pseudospiralis TaxID=6337 RepID=A0A0V0YGH1_TRIPS|nr:hypothetical protein T4E_1317 [Trichinella pseudospiralis]
MAIFESFLRMLDAKMSTKKNFSTGYNVHFSTAWNFIGNNTVINCFYKSGFRSKLPNSAVVKNTDKSVTISKEWQQIAETDVTFSDYLKGILEQHQADANKEDNDNDDDDDDKEQEVLPTLTLTAVLEAMDTLRRYVCSFDVDENVNNQMSKKGTVICELRKT